MTVSCHPSIMQCVALYVCVCVTLTDNSHSFDSEAAALGWVTEQHLVLWCWCRGMCYVTFTLVGFCCSSNLNLFLCGRLIWLLLSFECNLALLYFRIFTIVILFFRAVMLIAMIILSGDVSVCCGSIAEPSSVWPSFNSCWIIPRVIHYCISSVVHSSGNWWYVQTLNYVWYINCHLIWSDMML